MTLYSSGDRWSFGACALTALLATLMSVFFLPGQSLAPYLVGRGEFAGQSVGLSFQMLTLMMNLVTAIVLVTLTGGLVRVAGLIPMDPAVRDARRIVLTAVVLLACVAGFIGIWLDAPWEDLRAGLLLITPGSVVLALTAEGVKVFGEVLLLLVACYLLPVQAWARVSSQRLMALGLLAAAGCLYLFFYSYEPGFLLPSVLVAMMAQSLMALLAAALMLAATKRLILPMLWITLHWCTDILPLSFWPGVAYEQLTGYASGGGYFVQNILWFNLPLLVILVTLALYRREILAPVPACRSGKSQLTGKE